MVSFCAPARKAASAPAPVRSRITSSRSCVFSRGGGEPDTAVFARLDRHHAGEVHGIHVFGRGNDIERRDGQRRADTVREYLVGKGKLEQLVLRAMQLGAEVLMILTNVDAVFEGWGTPAALHDEVHDAGDFDTKTQDKLVGTTTKRITPLKRGR